MGLPFEQWREDEAEGAAGKDGAPPGCRTPGGSGQQQRQKECPAAPRKRRPAPAAGQQRREYYTGADVEEFFAAHNL
ncbi:hypothetical protein PR202_ga25613 [Eleusine coracana subsp. coracana]|uniref:Uncharacterized protein n=1 Tax=Eleusine coracana subsp. coracana TaxID=191504 RepID=A0AAV5D9Q8_ELECO|nr:hypothetical protein QOZ80_3AG0249700 [Eleusine coracana subsp. coracana]GJN07754.1 hypothetical protein PR202_ga25613 [Eleusine coracana subsp. coracana]